MTTETQITEYRESPGLEANRLALIKSVQDLIKQNLEQGVTPADYQIAGFSGMQNAGFDLAKSGIGAYSPYLQAGGQGVQAGMDAVTGASLPIMNEAYQQASAGIGKYDTYRDDSLQQMKDATSGGLGYLAKGAQGLEGTGEAFDPSSTAAFMNPYESAAVQQALADIQRQGDIQALQGRANAVSSGAFGGARSGIMEAEMGRNVLDQQGRTAANMRNAGYLNAQRAAQQAFEASKARQLQGAGMLGQMGSAYGSLGQAGAKGYGDIGLRYGALDQSGIGQLANIGTSTAGIGSQLANIGVQQAGIGELASRLNLSDVNTLMSLGGVQQSNQQSILDAQRANEAGNQEYPFKLYSFLSDIYKNNPGASTQFSTTSGSNASPFQQFAGFGLGALTAGAAAKKANLF